MPRTTLNKSQLIRDYNVQHPNARPFEIVDALKVHKISPALVSNVLHRADRGKQIPRLKGKRDLTVETLMAVKNLADRLGGLEAARAAIKALEKLGA